MATTINEYQMGDVVRITGTWTDADSAVIDPTTVLGSYKDPSGNTTAVSGGDITKSSTGVYFFDIDTDEPGKWYYRFYAQGAGGTAQGANEHHFEVVSEFYTP